MLQNFGCFHEKAPRLKYFMQILEKISAIVYNNFNENSATEDRLLFEER